MGLEPFSSSADQSITICARVMSHVRKLPGREKIVQRKYFHKWCDIFHSFVSPRYTAVVLTSLG